MKSVLVLYPHQLYSPDHLPKAETVVLVEDPLFYGTDQEYPRRLHKQKLILHRASVRRYIEEVLWPAGFTVEHTDLDVFMKTGDVFDRVSKAEQIFIIDPTDDALTKRLLQARRERPDLPTVTFLPSPNFYLKEHEVRQYFNERHKYPFAEFYQWQRERFNILIDENYKPVGGKWSYEDTAHKKPEPQVNFPSFPVFGDNKYVKEAAEWVNEHFPDNPGGPEFIWPTSHAEAKIWLDDFIENRIDGYAQYENTISTRSPWLHHSLLQSSFNIGLLTPQEAIETALNRHDARPIPLESLEGFIRQILGWREYVRGIYLSQGPAIKAQNPFNHHRKLTGAWYNGTTGLAPLDDLIAKLNDHAYGHNAERRMIAGTLMVLCNIQPEQMYRWHQELFIDAYDWTVVPNVYQMLQLNSANKGMSAAPYICPSNTIIESSDYDRGLWSDIWDGLFWQFIEKHKTSLSKHAQLRVMVQRLNRLDPDHKRIIYYRAEDFLNQHTTI